MAGSKRAVIVGIPGVGKSTVIARATELVSKTRKVRVATFGSLMFEEAQKKGLKDRDEIRRLPVAEQKRLQEMAAKRISEMQEEIVIVDTHLFISTPEGYYPGLPSRLLDIIQPTNFILVEADAAEIVKRRLDPERKRDTESAEEIGREQEISRAMASACSVVTGAPFATVLNSDGRVDDAAAKIAKILGGS